MNDPERTVARAESDKDEANRGPSLGLIYGFILLAMLVAIVVAAFIVYPFYHHH